MDDKKIDNPKNGLIDWWDDEREEKRKNRAKLLYWEW